MKATDIEAYAYINPKFKVGDKAIWLWASSAICSVAQRELHGCEWIYNIMPYDIWVSEKYLASPTTVPPRLLNSDALAARAKAETEKTDTESKEEKRKNAKENETPFAFEDVTPSVTAETTDKAEEKELDLCELLKHCEGEKFYSPVWREVELSHLFPANNNGNQPIVQLRLSNGCLRNIASTGHLSWGERFGNIVLFPSRELYEQYPFDAKKAWQIWADSQKPKSCLHVYWNCTIEDDGKVVAFASNHLVFKSKEDAVYAAQEANEYLTKVQEELNRKSLCLHRIS